MLTPTQIKARLDRLIKEDKKHTKEFVRELTEVKKSISHTLKHGGKKGKKCRKTRKGRK